MLSSKSSSMRNPSPSRVATQASLEAGGMSGSFGPRVSGLHINTTSNNSHRLSPSTSPGLKNSSFSINFNHRAVDNAATDPNAESRPLTPSTSPVRTDWGVNAPPHGASGNATGVDSMGEPTYSDASSPDWKFQLFNGPKDQHGEDLMQAVPMKSLALRLVPYCLIAFFLLANALNFTHERMLNPRNERPLPDLSEDIFPKIESFETGTNIIVWIQNIGAFITVWKLYLIGRGARAPQIGRQLLGSRFEFIVNNPLSRFILLPPMTIRARVLAHQRNKVWFEAFFRYFATYGTLLYIRSVVIVVTVLPATDNHCQNPEEITSWWGNVFMTVVTFGGSSIHCGDLLFSGHMTVITIGMLSVWEYGPIVNKYLRPVCAFAWMLAWFTILISRSHYTDDIIIAFTLTFLMFHLYKRTALVNKEGSTSCRLVRTVPRWMYCVLSPAYGMHCLKRVCARYDIRGMRINDQVAHMPPPYDIDAELGPAIRTYTTQAETVAARQKAMEETNYA